MLDGLLVDLVPYGKKFRDLEHLWRNNDSAFWSSGGDRYIVSRATIERQRQERAEEAGHLGPARGVMFGVQTKDGTPIGFFALNWLVPHSRLAMLGARIGDPAYWGGGYGTDALLLLIEYAFDWLDMRKLWLGSTSANARVMRQMEKAGFVLEARARRAALMDGAWHDGLLYGLLREEWPGREAMIERLDRRAKEYGDAG
ncbi:MAG: GNAT family protein [Chloroflexota bacterium]|jgi:RimJ/RimL family protein N-acetyltransferase|nr:GNAT family N-acetyltransferase [Anaerolineae bacterium]HMM27365.1 GNAT family protein [Aggregatilineaceae bacterium]